MFRLTRGQWLLLIALLVVGVAMQVGWLLLRTEPPRRAGAAAPPPPARTP